jgi:hypothetical protein
MLKKLLFLFCFYSFNLYSQSFPNVVCTAGNFSANFVYYNMGEPLTATLTQIPQIITQGFIQPPVGSIALTVNESKTGSTEVIAYPNPFFNHITVQIKNAGSENLSFQMNDILGRIVPVQFQTGGINRDEQEYYINTSFIEKGNYFIRVMIQYQTVNIIKVIKL